jgi:hypothetical protein
MMEKAKNGFAVLGLIWFTAVLMNFIFPHSMLSWHSYTEGLVYHLMGTFQGSKESELWLLLFAVVPACVILLFVFAGIGVESVIARAIRKARA